MYLAMNFFVQNRWFSTVLVGGQSSQPVSMLKLIRRRLEPASDYTFSNLIANHWTGECSLHYTLFACAERRQYPCSKF